MKKEKHLFVEDDILARQQIEEMRKKEEQRLNKKRIKMEN